MRLLAMVTDVNISLLPLQLTIFWDKSYISHCETYPSRLLSPHSTRTLALMKMHPTTFNDGRTYIYIHRSTSAADPQPRGRLCQTPLDGSDADPIRRGSGATGLRVPAPAGVDQMWSVYDVACSRCGQMWSMCDVGVDQVWSEYDVGCSRCG